MYLSIYISISLGEQVVESFFEGANFTFRFFDLLIQLIALEKKKKKKNGRPHTPIYLCIYLHAYLCMYLSTYISISIGEKVVQSLFEGTHFALCLLDLLVEFVALQKEKKK